MKNSCKINWSTLSFFFQLKPIWAQIIPEMNGLTLRARLDEFFWWVFWWIFWQSVWRIFWWIFWRFFWRFLFHEIFEEIYDEFFWQIFWQVFLRIFLTIFWWIFLMNFFRRIFWRILIFRKIFFWPLLTIASFRSTFDLVFPFLYQFLVVEYIRLWPSKLKIVVQFPTNFSLCCFLSFWEVLWL